jgi:hypothetical protein
LVIFQSNLPNKLYLQLLFLTEAIIQVKAMNMLEHICSLPEQFNLSESRGQGDLYLEAISAPTRVDCLKKSQEEKS